jgi:hypothetical protein
MLVDRYGNIISIVEKSKIIENNDRWLNTSPIIYKADSSDLET